MSADFENCFADDPAGVAETVRLAIAAGIADCSIEDWSGKEIHERVLEAARELIDAGSYDYLPGARTALSEIRAAFAQPQRSDERVR